MDEVTIKNFRCFQGRQNARLAPLTLLVGENSTGKTSLLAIIRELWSAIFKVDHRSTFKQEPFDLGSFREIAHQSEIGGIGAAEFSGGFTIGDTKCEATFYQSKFSAEVYKLRISRLATSVTWTRNQEGRVRVDAKTASGRWQFDSNNLEISELNLGSIPQYDLWGLFTISRYLNTDPLPLNGLTKPTIQDQNELLKLVVNLLNLVERRFGSDLQFEPPEASAPVRSRPRRTYNSGPDRLDPYGAGVPQYLAVLANSDAEKWIHLKSGIESLARKAGLFNEIEIRSLGDETGSDPFQVRVRKHSGDNTGRWQNIFDVGYGVSQILPVFIKLIRPEESSMLLLQQPEVHLHPSAQAGLGSILCDAAVQRQILVETHSDHLVNRVRMNVRDGGSDLKPKDVSILYFERSDNKVKIHNIRIDDDGNVVGQPPSYREFFRNEVNRSLGI